MPTANHSNINMKIRPPLTPPSTSFTAGVARLRPLAVCMYDGLHEIVETGTNERRLAGELEGQPRRNSPSLFVVVVF